MVELLWALRQQTSGGGGRRAVPGRSRPRLGVTFSYIEERAHYAGGRLRFAAQRPRAGRMSKDILTFPLSTCPANIALVGGRKNSTWPGRKGEATVDEYLQEAGLESRISLVTVSKSTATAAPAPDVK